MKRKRERRSHHLPLDAMQSVAFSLERGETLYRKRCIGCTGGARKGRKLVKGEKRDGSMHRGWSKHRGVGG